MSTVSERIPNLSITSWAWASDSGLDVRYGIRTAITLSSPSASAARNAVSEESTPPDTPTMPRVNPRRRTTSSFKKATSHLCTRSPSMARGSPLRAPPPTTRTGDAGCVGPVGSWVEFHLARLPLPQGREETGKGFLEIRQQRRIDQRMRDLLQVDVRR